MRAGKLDRRVTIRRATVEKNDLGEAIETWGDVATVWAEQVPMRVAERFSAQQITGNRLETFRIRYRADVMAADRLYYNGREYNILDVREVGRRVGTEIDAAARD